MSTADAAAVNGYIPMAPATAPADAPRARTRASHLRPVPAAAPTAAPAEAAEKTPFTENLAHVAATAAHAASAVAARPVTWLRVVYDDGTDSWIVQDRTLSMGEVFHAEYAVPGDYRPFQLWCKGYTRSAGVFFAAVCDGAKWLLIHPVRGPITIVGTVAGFVAPHLF